MTSINIWRNLAFFVGALFLMGSGCHTATSPTNNANDTIRLALHYQYANISFAGILMATDDTRSDGKYETRGTDVSSSSGYLNGEIYSRLPIDGLSSLVKDTIILLQGSMTIDNNTIDFAFQNIPVTYHGDSIICSLKGIQASSHIITLFDKTTTIHMGGMPNDYTEYFTRTYLECTDNTYITFALPKLQ